MKSLMVRFVREDAGQDLIEYALLASFIAAVAFVGAQAAGVQVLAWYNALAGWVETMVGLVPA